MWVEQLYPEQRPSFEFVISREGTLLISEVSAGKTYISMAALEHLAPSLTLVVAPLTSLDITWAPKLATLPQTICRSWEAFKETRAEQRGRPPAIHLVNSILRLPGAEFKETRAKTRGRPPASHALNSKMAMPGAVLLIHHQLLAKLGKKLEAVPWDFVIIDESQSIKDRASATSRAARRLRHAKRRLALSATPLDKSPIDIWAQMRFVDHTVLGEDWGPFEREFCYRGGFKDHEIKFRSELLPTLLQRLERHIFRLDKAFLQLKPMHIHMVPVSLLGAQRALYVQMETHGIAKVFNGTTIPAPLKVSRQVKLEQMTGGTVKDLDGHSHVIGYAKQRKLRVLLDKLTPPIVIFCKYLAEIPLIAAAIPTGRGVSVLTGAVTGDERTQLINDFQNNKIDYLICQMKTGGVSIELTAAATLIFYSLNFSLIDFEQVCGRFHRGSQTREVNVYILHAVDTVDQEIIDEIEAKKATFYSVVEHFTS
jgi:SNF2 family DNA or RNA helicase